MMARSTPTDPHDPDTCPDCSQSCDHSSLDTISPTPCCETLLALFDFDTPLATVIQCSACLRLWEWCGTIDGKGVVILVNPNLENEDDNLRDC